MHFFGLFLFTLLFDFTDLDTSKPVTENAGYYTWFVVVVFACSHVLMILLYFPYSTSKDLKEASYSEENYSASRTPNIIKSLVLLALDLGLFGFIFFAMTGFVMVFVDYDHVMFVCFILQIIFDFILMEVLWSFLVAAAASMDKDGDGFCVKALSFITKIRRSA
jgi:hypothetical protein